MEDVTDTKRRMDSTLRLEEQIAVYDFRTEMYVVNAKTNCMFATNALGRAIIMLLSQRSLTGAQVADAIAKVFNVDLALARCDVSEFLQRAVQLGVIVATEVEATLTAEMSDANTSETIENV